MTWAFMQSQLHETVEDAWEALEPSSEEILVNVNMLPSLTNHKQLPYRSRSSMSSMRVVLRLTLCPDKPCFTVWRIPRHLQPEMTYLATDKVACHLCEKVLPLSQMRGHVGMHILREFRKADDPLRRGNVCL